MIVSQILSAKGDTKTSAPVVCAPGNVSGDLGPGHTCRTNSPLATIRKLLDRHGSPIWTKEKPRGGCGGFSKRATSDWEIMRLGIADRLRLEDARGPKRSNLFSAIAASLQFSAPLFDGRTLTASWESLSHPGPLHDVSKK